MTVADEAYSSISAPTDFISGRTIYYLSNIWSTSCNQQGTPGTAGGLATCTTDSPTAAPTSATSSPTEKPISASPSSKPSPEPTPSPTANPIVVTAPPTPNPTTSTSTPTSSAPTTSTPTTSIPTAVPSTDEPTSNGSLSVPTPVPTYSEGTNSDDTPSTTTEDDTGAEESTITQFTNDGVLLIIVSVCLGICCLICVFVCGWRCQSLAKRSKLQAHFGRKSETVSTVSHAPMSGHGHGSFGYQHHVNPMMQHNHLQSVPMADAASPKWGHGGLRNPSTNSHLSDQQVIDDMIHEVHHDKERHDSMYQTHGTPMGPGPGPGPNAGASPMTPGFVGNAGSPGGGQVHGHTHGQTHGHYGTPGGHHGQSPMGHGPHGHGHQYHGHHHGAHHGHNQYDHNEYMRTHGQWHAQHGPGGVHHHGHGHGQHQQHGNGQYMEMGSLSDVAAQASYPAQHGALQNYDGVESDGDGTEIMYNRTETQQTTGETYVDPNTAQHWDSPAIPAAYTTAGTSSGNTTATEQRAEDSHTHTHTHTKHSHSHTNSLPLSEVSDTDGDDEHHEDGDDDNSEIYAQQKTAGF